MAKKKRARGRSGPGFRPHSNGAGTNNGNGTGYGPAGHRPGGGGTGKPPGRKFPRPQHGGQQGGQRPDAEPLGEPLGPPEPCAGVLEMHPSGYGFLRDPKKNYTRDPLDPFVPATLIQKFRLREGIHIHGTAQVQRKMQGPRVKEILDVDGMTPEAYGEVKNFDELTPINPEQWLKLETGPEPISTRIIDLLAPLGKGQRALIVAPPRSGKTVLLQQISAAISKNHPEVKLFVLLIDERPEEVTEMRRMVKGEVIYSSLDRETESHARLAEVCIERAKRLVEMKQDVFVLLDSITRLARAFNKLSSSNRTMSGGIDIRAMDTPKKLFATARAFEEGGSVTIVGTALVDTGSRMDEVIFQEFKGTGNMELVLDRKLADRRIWPAIDIAQSGTRREEKLLDADYLNAVTMLRRTLNSMNPAEAMEQLTRTLAKFPTNEAFIDHIGRARAKA